MLYSHMQTPPTVYLIAAIIASAPNTIKINGIKNWSVPKAWQIRVTTKKKQIITLTNNGSSPSV